MAGSCQSSLAEATEAGEKLPIYSPSHTHETGVADA